MDPYGERVSQDSTSPARINRSSSSAACARGMPTRPAASISDRRGAAAIDQSQPSGYGVVSALRAHRVQAPTDLQHGLLTPCDQWIPDQFRIHDRDDRASPLWIAAALHRASVLAAGGAPHRCGAESHVWPTTRRDTQAGCRAYRAHGSLPSATPGRTALGLLANVSVAKPAEAVATEIQMRTAEQMFRCL